MNTTLPLMRSLTTLTLAATLFATARRRYGWAALHDLASGTRVVSRSAIGARRIGTSLGSLATATVSRSARLRYGPFDVVADIGATWSILRPTRGPHDRLVGSWIVPR